MEINWLAVLLAGLAGIAIGAIWFGPKTFFPIWWKFMGRSQDEQAAGSAGPAVSFGLTFLAAFIQAIALALILELAQTAMLSVTAWDGLAIGALVGFAFAAAPSLGHKLFGGLSLHAWVIEVGQDILSLAAMGAIIAAMG
jgi:hypothetical protein